MTEREGTNEPGGADEIAAAHDALHAANDARTDVPPASHPWRPVSTPSTAVDDPS